ncbi:probable E3 ubiquitin-protein ligase MARCHF10 isoform X5 [Mesocricetus auratus]|uniref:RING-type E3 ubiquitin transferase n=1 Tax=Mesocricetus auratus TaxID=10036 RepID=A0ABM2XUC6_MESAU|nr:probable E3 ubiquitin-protein ligase MARCHF10 isoform X5 [Mesocricetus auratus]
MLHEARDRQKFVSDVQYLRDMQHKVDSEYQACLKRQEFKKDSNEKKQDQLWGKDTSDRSRTSSGSSSKQSSSEEDSLSEPRSSTKLPTAKCEPKLPAIGQTSVKQKHKSTMTPKKPEKVSTSKPSPAAQAPKILSRKRRPNLGRLTVSPEMHSPRASGERSRQKPQLSAKALLGAVSDFPNQNDHEDSIRIHGVNDEKGATEIKADPEKLRKLQESLLEEDSEEEGDLCRICQIAGGSPTNPLLEPCGCVGSLQFVHQECLKKWLKVKITSGADLGTVKTCEMCKQSLLVDLDDFNMTEFYHKHQQFRQAQSELMNSGLYLVLLLYLYEQRFAELMTLNYRRASRERVPSREMVMKAVFTQAGSSSEVEECSRDRSTRMPSLRPPCVPSSLLFTETEANVFTVAILTCATPFRGLA